MPLSVENKTNAKSNELPQDWYYMNICRTASTFSLWTLNSFQIMALIVFREFLPLGTGSYTPTSSIHLLLLKPSTCDCESRMSCTRSRLLITRFSLSAWFMTALAWLLKVKRRPEEEESQTFVSFIGVCASLCFRRQSSAGTSRGMLTIMASRELWTRNAKFGALPKMICCESPWMALCLSEREQRALLKPRAFTAEWFSPDKL